jgi:uncharacterized protein with gpF-like domain
MPVTIRGRTRKAVVVRATQPNAGVRVWYQKQLEAIIGEMHLDISLQLSLAFAETPPDGITHDARKRSPQANIDRTLKDWSKKWTLKLDKMSLDISKKFAGKSFTMSQATFAKNLADAGFTIKFQPTQKALNAYKGEIAENVNLIKAVADQYKTNVQSAVWNSVRVGGKMSDLSKSLHKEYGVSVNRAALIARDQNAKATATIDKVRRLQLGLTQARWQHSSAGKEPRPTHVEFDGVLFEIETGMWDPDADGKGKGRFVQPGQLINCRCTSSAIIPGFED